MTTHSNNDPMSPDEMRLRLAIIGALVIDRKMAKGERFKLIDRTIGSGFWLMSPMFDHFMMPNPKGERFDSVANLNAITEWLDENNAPDEDIGRLDVEEAA